MILAICFVGFVVGFILVLLYRNKQSAKTKRRSKIHVEDLAKRGAAAFLPGAVNTGKTEKAASSKTRTLPRIPGEEVNVDVTENSAYEMIRNPLSADTAYELVGAEMTDNAAYGMSGSPLSPHDPMIAHMTENSAYGISGNPIDANYAYELVGASMTENDAYGIAGSPLSHGDPPTVNMTENTAYGITGNPIDSSNAYEHVEAAMTENVVYGMSSNPPSPHPLMMEKSPDDITKNQFKTQHAGNLEGWTKKARLFVLFTARSRLS